MILFVIESENSNSLNISGVNSIPSLLMTVLRTAVSDADLPHLNRIIHRTPPIIREPSKQSLIQPPPLSKTVSAIQHCDSVESLPLSLSTSESASKGAQTPRIEELQIESFITTQPSQPFSDPIQLRSFCPELSSGESSTIPINSTHTVFTIHPTTLEKEGALFSLSRGPEAYKTTIKLKDGAPTIEKVSKDLVYLPTDFEPLQKKSTSAIRRTVYEQTARILRPNLFSNKIIYDVMDENAYWDALTEAPR
jgi:hypothetical protein